MARIALIIVLLLGALSSHAQAPPLPHLFPPGARQGATVTVTVGASDLPADARVWVEGDGISVGPVKEGKVELTVAPDAAPGVRKLRVVTSQGASVARPFVVGVLPEVNETEPNNAPNEAMALTLPVTVNGQITSRNDPDSFRVRVKAGECLVVAAEARRLGAPTDLVLRLLDARGVELATCEDYNDRDPLIACVVPADGEYLVQAYDVMTNYSTVNADYTYRLTFTTGPYLDRVFPPAVPHGTTARVTLTGWNLDGKPGAGALTRSVEVPADAGPTLAVTAPDAANTLTVAVANRPDVAEIEPNDEPARGQVLTSPATVTAALERRGDVDWYRIAAAPNERFVFRVEAQALGSPLDGILMLQDRDGTSLAESDDAEGLRDPVIRWTAPAAGEYYLGVRDIGTPARGGPEFLYRLSVDAPRPGLALALTDPSPVVVAGEKTEITLTLTRRDGATGEVEIFAEGLPTGVTAEPLKIAGSSSAGTGALTSDVKLALVAAPDAAPGAAPIRILAASRCAGARCAAGGDLTAVARATFPLATDRSGTVARGTTEQLLLVVRPKPTAQEPGK